MKNLLLLLTTLLALVTASCSKESSLLEEQPSTEVSFATRSTDIDSVILNSPLLNKIYAFNDSIINNTSSASQTRSDYVVSNNLNITPITCADIIGWIIGYWKAKKDGFDVAMIVATMTSAQASNEKAKSMVQTQNYPLQVPTTNSFKQYENCFSAITQDCNYVQNCNLQIATLGDLTKFNRFRRFFKVGVDHNLILEKYKIGLSDTDIVTNLFSSQVNDIIYSSNYQNQLSDLINDIVNNDINYSGMFYNFDEQTQTYSQYKAGELLKAYVDVMTRHPATLETVKSIALEYLNQTINTTELSDYEKDLLMNAIPIGITSFSYWKSNIISK